MWEQRPLFKLVVTQSLEFLLLDFLSLSVKALKDKEECISRNIGIIMNGVRC